MGVLWVKCGKGAGVSRLDGMGWGLSGLAGVGWGWLMGLDGIARWNGTAWVVGMRRWDRPEGWHDGRTKRYRDEDVVGTGSWNGIRNRIRNRIQAGWGGVGMGNGVGAGWTYGWDAMHLCNLPLSSPQPLTRRTSDAVQVNPQTPTF